MNKLIFKAINDSRSLVIAEVNKYGIRFHFFLKNSVTIQPLRNGYVTAISNNEKVVTGFMLSN